MLKPSSRAIHGLLKLHFNHHLRHLNPPKSKPFYSSRSHTSLSPSNGLPNSTPSFTSQFQSPKLRFLGFASKSTSSIPVLSPRNLLGFFKQNGNSSGLRYFSVRSSNFSKVNGNFAKSIFDKPATAFNSTFSRYREAIGLQIDAFFNKNYLLLLGAGGVVMCALLWRIMFGIANTFIGFSEGLAKYGFLALSSAIVAFAVLYIRSRFTINTDKVYRIAMRKLNISAGILEVMGAPLAGTDLRAYVMSGGGLTLKNFKPSIRSKRCFLIFPIHGSDRTGLVSVEVKKKKGKYDMKLLAVDIPIASGPDQRLYLIGDEEEYKIGGGLISELRDPVVKAMAATKEFDNLDKIEEEEDAERELQEVERKRLEEIEKLEIGGQL